jgi:biopolymer transport protein ExbB
LEKVAWGDIIVAGWPVLSVMLIMSIIMVAITLERWKTFGRVNLDTETFLASVRKAPDDSQKIIAWCDKSDQPLALLTKNVYRAGHDREDKERHLERGIQSLVQKYERGLAVLGSIASVAPFIGLLGTVIGIIRAFHAVSTTSAGGASAVALGIAEALVGTAGGLVVAIPALLFYNYFVNRLRHLTQDWEIAGGELIDLAIKGRS